MTKCISGLWRLVGQRAGTYCVTWCFLETFMTKDERPLV